MFQSIIDLINQIDNSSINDHRKDLLKPLYDYLALKIKQKKAINLNFICTPIHEEVNFLKCGQK